MHDVVPVEKSFTKVTLPLGSGAARRAGSTPVTRTKSIYSEFNLSDWRWVRIIYFFARYGTACFRNAS